MDRILDWRRASSGLVFYASLHDGPIQHDYIVHGFRATDTRPETWRVLTFRSDSSVHGFFVAETEERAKDLAERLAHKLVLDAAFNGRPLPSAIDYAAC